MSHSTASAVCTPVQQSLAVLRNGQESFGCFVVDLFDDLETMRQKLLHVESQLGNERRQLTEDRRQLAEAHSLQTGAQAERDATTNDKCAELEQERVALEEELEGVRARAVAMAQTIAEQKRQMAEEHAEWAAELRQLRRILDKQATWIAQQAEAGMAPWAPVSHGAYAAPLPAGYPPTGAHAVNQVAHPAPGQTVRGYAPAYYAPGSSGAAVAAAADPVLGSVLSQFELLQKDVARRREKTVTNHANKNGTT